ncbi:hypothetical protein Dsin_011867 [Dipteronia sinensis]|uniref:DUF1985 domain-containing protein n=1 Tax=Dipteronia sinensis TaxID=43782 RepID=A0AAE0E7Y2_9ROSI|nr:hypothetical protein Dsin_011867 [Dipteronia sinensis]
MYRPQKHRPENLTAKKLMMRNQLNDFLKTSVGEWYDAKITRHGDFNDLRDINDTLNMVPEDLAIEDRRRYTESCFGHFLPMHREMQFSTGIVHRLLMRGLHHDGPEDEMRFMLGHHSVWFSKVEFCLITGLKFGVIPDMTTYQTSGIFDQQYDAVKLCLLYMLNWMMGLDEREKIPVWQFRLVDDLDAFDVFPWGAHVYRQSIYGFKHALDG